MAPAATEEAMCCSFCAKSQFDVAKLVAGPGVFICNECIDLCNQVISAEMKRKTPGNNEEGATGANVPPVMRAWKAASDEELLREMVHAHAAHQNVDRAVKLHVVALRERGLSWARIGEALGMTRQSAWERFSGEE